jgi:hypothetical protein
MDNNNAKITIDGEQYELIMTMRATREIGKRYGGLEVVADKLQNTANFEQVIEEVVWLITMLCNQGVLINNMHHPENQRPLLTDEKVELLTTPSDIIDFKDAIMECMSRGVKRAVENEPDPKNTEAG